jgi:uncharacterized protein YndB with AHSA1/START domain
MLKKVLLALLVSVLALVGLIASRPNTYHVERSATIAAPPEVAFAAVNDFHAWDAWSPWAKLDPNMQATYDGPASGPGQKYHWTGNDKVGEGEMRIAASTPSERVLIELDFLRPFKSSDVAAFTFVPEAGGTKVTWAMDGPANFISKAMCLITPMDKMIGPDFEKGLASLKRVAEAAAAKPATADSAAGGAVSAK